MNLAILNRYRVRRGPYASPDSYGFTGAFLMDLAYTTTSGKAQVESIKIIASDDLGWQHVSVSLNNRPGVCPRWEIMCAVKDLFWEPEDAVMQLHPPRSTYRNFALGCLHLWHPLEAALPLPPPDFVAYE